MLRDNDFKKVNIIIIETNDLLDSIMKDINLFNKIEKKYNVNIKIKYSKEYMDKNKIKQLNIAMFRGIMLILIIIGLIIFGITKFTERKTNDHFDVNVKIINDKINKSVYDFGVEVNDSDKILTLSTCYDNADHRLVIHAKKIS